MNISHAAFIPFKNTKLKGTKISTEPAETLSECVKKCEKHTNCQSANFEAKWCELLSENKHVSKEKLETSSGCTHVAKMNRGCDRKKCHNNAICVPDYGNNTFSCKCKPEYTGKFCEVMLQSPIPDWWFKFDGGTENDGLKPNDAIVIAEDRDKNKAIFHGQPNRKGKYMECHFKCTKSTVTWPGWRDPEHHDFSFAVWIQFPPEHEIYQESFTGTVSIFATVGKGLSAHYSKKARGWLFDIILSDGYYHSFVPLSLEETKQWNFIAVSWRNGILIGFVNEKKMIKRDEGKWDAKQSQNLQLFHPHEKTIFHIDEFRVWYDSKSPEFMKQLYFKERTNMWH